MLVWGTDRDNAVTSLMMVTDFMVHSVLAVGLDSIKWPQAGEEETLVRYEEAGGMLECPHQNQPDRVVWYVSTMSAVLLTYVIALEQWLDPAR